MVCLLPWVVGDSAEMLVRVALNTTKCRNRTGEKGEGQVVRRLILQAPYRKEIHHMGCGSVTADGGSTRLHGWVLASLHQLDTS